MKRGFSTIASIFLANLAVITVGIGGVAYHAAASSALAEENTPAAEPVAVVVFTNDESEPAYTNGKRPIAVVYDYQIGVSFVESVARGMYGLDTPKEKIGFACLVVNRIFCNLLRADGKPIFPKNITQCVEQPGEFLFYRADAPVTDENYALAEYIINAQFTFIMTKQYTGYIFPSTMLYMGWVDGDVVYYMERGGDPWRYAEKSER